MNSLKNPLKNPLPRTARRTPWGPLALALPLVLLTGCGAAGSEGASAGSSASEEADEHEEAPAGATEVAASTPRLAITHDGGITVLDATTFETVGELDLGGFNRLNAGGDGRHVMVSTTGGFRVLDAGTWGEPHGDHSHYWTAEPELTDLVYEAEEPGHVVVHEGRTVFFDDGTGQVTAVDTSDVGDPEAERRELTTPSAHHGVAVELTDGTLVVSEGTEDARTGIRVLDPEGEELLSSAECPGVHGEAVAADEAVVIGCEDGALVYADGEITKVTAPDAYGRIGNQAGSEESPIVLGDYKTDPDADPERPTRVSLIDTRDASLRLVDLPSSYTFRSLGRGEHGEALVLGTDGSLHVIDPEAGALVRSIPVTAPWEEPVEWQEPRPALRVHEGTAYVTDPARGAVHAVDVETGEVWKTVELPGTPNEIAVASGEAGEHDHADG